MDNLLMQREVKLPVGR